MGGPAINVTPRKMIENNVKACLQRLGISKQPNPFAVTISVPGGEEIARRTFNPRLGIEGGISIIGTSGIVKPFSSEAFVDSIRKSMEVGRATGSPRIVLNLSLIHISEPTRQAEISYAVFCLKKKK